METVKKDETIRNYIKEFKKRYGKRLLIPVHHYVPAGITEFSDITGDSYRLAVESAKSGAKWIVFCGVSFMAEAVKILASESQKVLMPEPDAGCPMADMIDAESALGAMKEIENYTGAMPAPVIYMNSSTECKSLCGEYSGSVCTSSNAEKIIRHYFSKGKKVFFFPDFNLGMNMAKVLGLRPEETAVVKNDLTVEFTGLPESVKLFLWDGFCPVHYRFTVRDIEDFRKKYPAGKVIVHPEVNPEIELLADDYGSTQKIYDMIRRSEPGSVWGVGTEVIFVNRMAQEFPDRIIVPLGDYTCVNMSKNNLENLAEALHSIEVYESGTGDLKNEVTVDSRNASLAKIAIDKMISIVEEK